MLMREIRQRLIRRGRGLRRGMEVREKGKGRTEKHMSYRTGRVTSRYSSNNTPGSSSGVRSTASRYSTTTGDRGRSFNANERDSTTTYSSRERTSSRYGSSRERDSSSRYSSRERDTSSRFESRLGSRYSSTTSARYEENDYRSNRLSERTTDTSDYIIKGNVNSDDNSKLQKEAQEERSNISKLENVISRFERELEEELRKENELDARLQFRVQEGEDRKRKLEDNLNKLQLTVDLDLKKLQDDLAKGESRLSDLESKIKSKEATAQREFNKTIEELERNIADEKRQLASVGEKRISELEDLIREEKLKLRKIQDEKNRSEEEFKSSSKGMQEEKEKETLIEDMRKELSEKQRTASKLKSEVDRQEMEMRQVREEAEILSKEEEERVQLKQNLRDLEDELRKLEDENNTLETDRRRTEKDLERQMREQREAALAEIQVERDRERERTRTTTSTTSTTSVTDDFNEDSEKKIKNLKRKIRDKGMEWENELEDYQKSQKDASDELEATVQKKKQMQDRVRDLELLIRQQTELNQNYSDEAQKRITYLEKENSSILEELAKVNELNEKLDMTQIELKAQVELNSTNFTFARDKSSKLEVEIKQNQRSTERKEKDLKAKLTDYRDVKDNLTDIEASLAQTQQDLEMTIEEYRIVKEDLESEQETLEHELYILTGMKEYFMIKNYELDKEYADVSWYFKPVEEQAKTIPQNSTSMYRYILENIEKRKQKTETTKKIILDGRPKSSSLDELSNRFQTSLSVLQAEDPESHFHTVRELKEFFIKLDVAETAPKLKLWLSTVLVENQVYPGAIRELGNLVDQQLLSEIHPLHTPEWLLKFTYRESINNPDISFRRILLNSLVDLKVKQTNRTAAECEDYIFLGRWRDIEEIQADMEQYYEEYYDEEYYDEEYDEEYNGEEYPEEYNEEYNEEYYDDNGNAE
eukprot:TRINITY_DN13018_c0_g1_i1.p1 TRINITY_DN13018_c0_g1~~TRINITY_DN13018_c0_g1_i1.p1  ORF type:complete len:934 (-),score=257.22 TRINITY_DN13018_c0_g1_i1:8-2809(-)